MLQSVKRYTKLSLLPSTFRMKRLREIGWDVESVSNNHCRFDQAHLYRKWFWSPTQSLITTNSSLVRYRLVLHDRQCPRKSLLSFTMKWQAWWILKTLLNLFNSQILTKISFRAYKRHLHTLKVTNSSSRQLNFNTDLKVNFIPSMLTQVVR